MDFTKHSTLSYELKDKHAFLSPSKYHWLRYDQNRLADAYLNSKASEKGVRLHSFASEAIDLGIKMRGSKDALSCFINDAIGYKMNSEQFLYYSDLCFGTADAISFRRDVLRIHDLKTGLSRASFDQLKVYAAIFFLEYEISPLSLNPGSIILRIYQFDGYEELIAEAEEIVEIMYTIKNHDSFLRKLCTQ